MLCKQRKREREKPIIAFPSLPTSRSSTRPDKQFPQQNFTLFPTKNTHENHEKNILGNPAPGEDTASLCVCSKRERERGRPRNFYTFLPFPEKRKPLI